MILKLNLIYSNSLKFTDTDGINNSVIIVIDLKTVSCKILFHFYSILIQSLRITIFKENETCAELN